MTPRRFLYVWVVLALFYPSALGAQSRLPFGSHDGFEGGAHNFLCTADGWAVDPDNRDVDLEVRVLANGFVVGQVTANQFRPDLEANGVCPGGTCAFRFLLWDQIPALVAHAIRVEARDLQTDEWTPLAGTPKMIRCFGFPLTVFDLKTRDPHVASNLPFVTGHFGASWSPIGGEVAYTAVGWRSFPDDFITQLYITNIDTGVSEAIAGGECGGNAVWSPDPDLMAFDGLCNLAQGIYVGLPRAGERRLVRANAFHPEWSPDGRRLVFVAAEDTSLRTIDLSTGIERILGPRGVRPAWSPDGHWIAFQTVDLHISKIRVTRAGAPSGSAIQLTFGPLIQGRPAWSKDSRPIFFHTETRTPTTGHPLDEEFRVWQMSASGDRVREITSETGMAIDIASWTNGRALAFAGSPLRP